MYSCKHTLQDGRKLAIDIETYTLYKASYSPIIVCVSVFFFLTLSQTTNFRPCKEFADDNSIFDENGNKLSKRVENTVGKGEIAHYEQFFLLPTVFSKDLYCRHVKIRA